MAESADSEVSFNPNLCGTEPGRGDGVLEDTLIDFTEEKQTENESALPSPTENRPFSSPVRQFRRRLFSEGRRPTEVEERLRVRSEERVYRPEREENQMFNREEINYRREK